MGVLHAQGAGAGAIVGVGVGARAAAVEESVVVRLCARRHTTAVSQTQRRSHRQPRTCFMVWVIIGKVGR